MTNVELLRAELANAIEAVLAAHFPPPPAALASPTSATDSLRIVAQEPLSEAWTYQWPKTTESFPEGHWYSIMWATDSTRVLVARCTRYAWGRVRGRVIVFGQFGQPDAKTFYPWTEFVETDDSRYAADVPVPASPRKRLKAGMDIPAQVQRGTLARNDELFDSVQNGPVLRLVLSGTEEEAMIRHGHWVATLRGHIS